MKQKNALILLLLCIFIAPCFSAEKTLQYGGSLKFSFGDEDISKSPGPQFDTDKKGNIGNVSLYLRNRKVQAGLTLSLAQGTDNVKSIGTDDVYPFPLKNAYLRFTDVFDLFRVKLNIRGDSKSWGTMAIKELQPDPVNKKLEYEEDNMILYIGLEPGIVGDFTFGIETTQLPGEAATKTEKAIENVWGVKSITRYDGELFSAKLDLGVLNHRDAQETFFAALESSSVLNEDINLEYNLEGCLTGLTEEFMGVGGGLQLDSDFMNIKTKARILAKNKHFGKNKKLVKINCAKDDFNTRTGNNELAWDIETSYNLREIIGNGLISVKAGFNQITTNVKRSGWKTGFDLNFFDFGQTPLTAGFSIGQYGDKSLGRFGNSNVLWSGFVSYNYHGAELKAEAGRKIYSDPQKPDEGISNTTTSYKLSAYISF